MSTVGDLKRILGEFKQAYNVEVCAVVSRNGIPIAWELPEGAHIETFATLSATILGASEVVYSGLGRDAPDRIIVESKGGNLVATSLGTKALLVAMSSRVELARLATGVEETAKTVREVLKYEKGKF